LLCIDQGLAVQYSRLLHDSLPHSAVIPTRGAQHAAAESCDETQRIPVLPEKLQELSPAVLKGRARNELLE
jgi:hypothetical protein